MTKNVCFDYSKATAFLTEDAVSDMKKRAEEAKNVLRRQTHINDITPRDFVEVCVDMMQQGVAGYDSWGSRPEPWAIIKPNQTYEWGFTITPLK